MVFIHIYKKLLIFHRNIGETSLIPITIGPSEEAGYHIFKQEKHSQFLSPSHILARSSSGLAEGAQAEAARSDGCSAPSRPPAVRSVRQGPRGRRSPEARGSARQRPAEPLHCLHAQSAAAPRRARAATLQAFPAEGCRAVPRRRD